MATYKENGNMGIRTKFYPMGAGQKETWLPWQQPILASFTSYGNITYGSMITHSTASNNKQYQALNSSNTPANNYQQFLGNAGNNTSNWVYWQLPSGIILKISGITIYNRYNATTTNYVTGAVKVYTDSTKTTQIAYNNSGSTSQRTAIVLTCDNTIQTNGLYFYFEPVASRQCPNFYQTIITAEYKG
jgi:hypothetical protein